jgi:predicted enzyme related to lactoylglutathione lyase
MRRPGALLSARMGTFLCITIDCADATKMATFWAASIEGYSVDPSGIFLRSDTQPMIFLQQVPEPKSVKNRVHLELVAADRAAQTERLISLGATKVQDYDETGRQWTVLRDPDGQEFCLQQGKRESDRPRLVEVVFDSHQSGRTARFWASALDSYAVRPYDDEEIAKLKLQGIDDVIDDPMVAVDSDGDRPNPTVFFQTVPEPKVTKNRIHIDLSAQDIDAEGSRLTEMGATVSRDVSDGSMRWVVTSDPEGNEFCVCKA